MSRGVQGDFCTSHFPMPKKAEQPASHESDLAFEDALTQLEELVQDMESDRMPLEELIEKYERGSNLYRICEKRLDEAQGRIEIIRKKRNGETVVEPFGEEEAKKEKEEDPNEEDPESEEHGELF